MKTSFVTAAAAAVLVALAAGSAQARPALRVVDLQVGQDQFFRLAKGSHVVSDAPQVVSAEVLPSDEVLLTPKTAGRALLFVMVDGVFDAIRVRVREQGGKSQELRATDEQLAAARKACPKLQVDRGPERSTLETDIGSGACRAALLSLFETDEFLAKDLSLMFTEEVLREQYAAIGARMTKQGLDKVFQVAYAGVTLRIKGKATVAQKMELLRIVYDETPGRVLLDDQSELVEPEPAAAGEPAASDAGVPAARP